MREVWNFEEVFQKRRRLREFWGQQTDSGENWLLFWPVRLDSDMQGRDPWTRLIRLVPSVTLRSELGWVLLACDRHTATHYHTDRVPRYIDLSRVPLRVRSCYDLGVTLVGGLVVDFQDYWAPDYYYQA